MNELHWKTLKKAEKDKSVVRVFLKNSKPGEIGTVQALAPNSHFRIFGLNNVEDYREDQVGKVEVVSISELFKIARDLKQGLNVFKERLRDFTNDICS